VEGVAEARVDGALEAPEPTRRRARRGPAPRTDREADDVDADASRIGPDKVVAVGATRARAAAPPKLAIALAARQPRPPVSCSARGGQRRNAVRRLTAPRVCAARRGTPGGGTALSDFGAHEISSDIFFLFLRPKPTRAERRRVRQNKQTVRRFSRRSTAA